MSVYRRRKQGTSQTASTRWRQFWAKLETGGIRPSPTCFSSSGRHVSLPNLQDCILTERYRRHETLELYRMIRNIPPWAPLNQVSPEHCDCILLATHGVLKGGRSHNTCPCCIHVLGLIRVCVPFPSCYSTREKSLTLIYHKNDQLEATVWRMQQQS